jgi:putative glycosyltransferase (TIGR04372 family)
MNAIINKIWKKLDAYLLGRLTLKIIFFITYILLKNKKLKHWQLIKIKYFCLIGLEKINFAVKLLIELEKNNKYKKNKDIKILYLTLSNYCIKNNKLKLAIKLFKYRVLNSPEDLWAWRILLDFNYYLCNFEEVSILHQKYINREIKYNIKHTNNNNKIQYFGNYYTHSIGHICILADHIISKKLTKNNYDKDILYIDKDLVANYSLLKYLIPFYEVKLKDNLEYHYDDIEKLENPFAYFFKYQNKWYHWYDIRSKIYSEWFQKKNEPLLTINDEDAKYGRIQLNKKGVKDSDWFVVMHVRSSSGGSNRNADILTYTKAIDLIIKNGGWVIRIGDNKMPLMAKRNNFIDLSQDLIKDDRLDTYLLGSCLFSIVSTSGPANVPILFGKSSIQTNLIPFRHSVPYNEDIILPVLYYSKDKKRLLTFREIIKSNISYSEISIRSNLDIILIKNDEDDILNAVKEMLNKKFYKESCKQSMIQLKFKNICNELNLSINPQVSDSFLIKYSDLL